MPPEKARREDVRAWLSKAALDLKAATHEMSAPDKELWGDILFHAQQAAEKSLKAFLAGTTCRSVRHTTLKNSASSAKRWIRRWPPSQPKRLP